MRQVVLIPAYQPDSKLLATLRELQENGIERIVVVNDGSRPECLPVLEKAALVQGVTVLHHAANRGKGQAMKTGFNHVLLCEPAGTGVIVCDADGQHPIHSLLEVAAEMDARPGALVLGARQFSKAKNMPFPNLVGNTVSRLTFLLTAGLWYADTQGGLRGYPWELLPALLDNPGDRFEYENTMLLMVRSRAIPVVEVPMEAVYLGKNESSHFNRLQDSIRINGAITRWISLPIFTALMNLGLFFLFSPRFPAWSTLVCFLACGLSLVCNARGFSKGKRAAPCLAGFVIALGAAGVFGCLYHLAGWAIPGAWWLAMLPTAVVSHWCYLRMRYGKRPAFFRKAG